MISGRQTDYGATASENQTALRFFLDRATRARLLFDGCRLQDVRMRSYRAAPVVVAAAAGNVATVALLLQYGVADESVRAAIAYLRDTVCGTASARSCLDVLHRAVVVCEYSDADSKCKGNVVQTPPILMHLARCAVRKTLYDNFYLPRGIPQLPVPQSLVSYLNIEQ